MDIVVATNNRNKLEEIRRMLTGVPDLNLISLADAGVESEPEENGKTFAENAMQKAKAACVVTQRPAIADDSGLEVDVLNGAPGVLSARFAGEPPNDEANNKRLLGYLTRTPYAQRGAHFVCAIALVMPDGRRLTTEGRLDGVIGFAPSGDNGFGYDPLFYVKSRSLADISPEEKDRISHRAIALQKLKEQLPGFLGTPAAEPAPAAEPEPAEPAPEPASEAAGQPEATEDAPAEAAE